MARPSRDAPASAKSHAAAAKRPGEQHRLRQSVEVEEVPVAPVEQRERRARQGMSMPTTGREERGQEGDGARRDPAPAEG